MNNKHSKPNLPECCDPKAPWSEEMAQWYSHHHGEHACNRRTIELAKIRPDDIHLDIGCGSGSAVRYAATLLTQGASMGLDYSPAMVDIARAQTQGHPHADRIEFQEAEASALPVPDGSQTLVTAINSLHHWIDMKAGLAEVHRVLRDGGRVVICEEIFTGEDAGRGMNGDAVEELLADGGFEVIENGVNRADDTGISVVIGVKTS